MLGRKKTSKYLLKVVKEFLGHIHNYIIDSSLPFDFTFEQNISRRIKKHPEFLYICEAFKALVDTIKETYDRNQKERANFQKNEQDLNNSVDNLKQKLLNVEAERDEALKREEEATKREREVKEREAAAQNKVTKLEKDLEAERRKSETLAAENTIFQKQLAEKKAVGEVIAEGQCNRANKNRHVWLEQNTLATDKSIDLKTKMTALYGETLRDLEVDILKLLNALQYEKIKKHEEFQKDAASRQLEINRLLHDGDDAVDDKYKELISSFENERASLQRLVNVSEICEEDAHVLGKLKQIEEIIRNTELLEKEVELFRGSKTEKKYLDLDHKLMSNIMKVDVIQSEGNDKIRRKRIEAIVYATQCTEKLDANATKEA